MKKAIFVVQEHWATHHHFDLRLEKDGVLKSWAIPKSLPLQKGEKRLAIAVDDHDLSYADFEGEISEGYGRGTVRIWDRGTYKASRWEENEILLVLEGKKLRGSYALIRAKKGKFALDGSNWLFLKRKEEEQ